MKNSPIYITGASGFVGKNLINYLTKNNICFQGFSRTKANRCQIVLNYDEIDVNNNAILVHLAQSPFIYGHNSLKDIETCQHLVKKGWKHIIYLSSTLIYGDQNEKLNKSETDLTNITYDKKYEEYIKVKIESEKIFHEAGATCLRTTNIYGDGMSKNSIIFEIIKKAINEKTIQIENCETVRDFISINDVVSCIYSSSKKMKNCTYNLASGDPIKIYDLAKLINFKAGNSVKVVCKGSFYSQIMLDISDTKKDLDWQPVCDISTYLDELIPA